MNRTLLTIAAALLGATTLFGSAAQACISCEYVPEVIKNSSTSHGAKAYEKKRVIVASKERSARPAQKRVAKIETAKAEPARVETGARKVETAKAAPVETRAETETSAPVADAGATPAEETKVADLGCKKFIATVGTTVSVPCE